MTDEPLLTRKLSELSNEQKSRWIAEKLGWKLDEKGCVTLKGKPQGFHHPQCSCQQSGKDDCNCFAGEDIYLQRPSRAFAENDRYECGELADFVNDPAMTVMLLKKLRESHKVVRLTAGTMIWARVGSEAAPDGETRTLNDIGQAVADAFMLANGWKGE